jgi:peptidoglycan hydrolase CwlO-like protein
VADVFVRSVVAPQSKRTAVAMEYTYLLTSQLESQRQFWEHQLQVKKKSASLSMFANHKRLPQHVCRVQVVESQKGEKVQHLEHELKKEKEEKQGLLASINELNQTQHKSKKKITQLEKKISQYQRDVKELKQVLTHWRSILRGLPRLTQSNACVSCVLATVQ